MVLLRRQTSLPDRRIMDHYGEYDVVTNNFHRSQSQTSSYYDEDPELYDCRLNKNTCKSSRSGNVSQSNKLSIKSFFNFFQYIVFTAIIINVWRTHYSLSQTGLELTKMTNDYIALQDSLLATEIELRNANQDYQKLTKRFNTSPKNNDHLHNELIQREQTQARRIDAMQKYIQQVDHDDLLQRFGPGPYKIEVNVIMNNKPRSIVMETAPIDQMPHAIRTFMDFVQNHVFDDTLFIHKVEHVVLAAPIDLDGNLKNREMSKSLLFPEYSEKFPHVEHTVGFQGRPGGPQIYINLDDNSHDHGPGGQKQYDLVEEADPCFAKVISGFDVLKDMISINEKATEKNEVHYTKIEYMKLVTLK